MNNETSSVTSTALNHIIAVRIYYRNDHIPMADLKYASGRTETIKWANDQEYKRAAALMNAYTLIYDLRPKASFNDGLNEIKMFVNM